MLGQVSATTRSSLRDLTAVQLVGGFSVPIFQIIIPSYSERWFDLKNRTTATMIMGLGEHVNDLAVLAHV